VVQLNKKTKIKSAEKPVAPARKPAKKASAAPSAQKLTSSTARKAGSAKVARRGGRSTQAITPADPSTKPSKAAVGRPRSTTKPASIDDSWSQLDQDSETLEQVETSPTSQDPIQYPEETTRKVKSYLNAKQLREFKTILLDKRDELTGDVERLTAEALKGNGQDRTDHSTMPIHMADLGSDTWEQDFTIGLIANEQNLVREIDDALERIADKTYGMCLATDKEISLARLNAIPWAKYCIEYERAREEGRAP